MKSLFILSPSAAAGKTVWTVGFVRALRELGLRVGVFKPVSEDMTGHAVPSGHVSTSALHLAAAAGQVPDAALNPVLLQPTGADRADVLLFGHRLGGVGRIGRDMAFIEDLGPALCDEIAGACRASFDSLGAQVDLLVAEGAGGATDLSLVGGWDLANVELLERATGALLVARACQGGGLAGIFGAASLVNVQVRQRLIGFALNDVRARHNEECAAGQRLATRLSLEYLGAVPWVSWFEGREKYDPFTPGSEEDHLALARAVREHVNIPRILSMLGVSHVL